MGASSISGRRARSRLPRWPRKRRVQAKLRRPSVQTMETLDLVAVLHSSHKGSWKYRSRRKLYASAMPSLDKCIGGMETPRWLGASGQLRVNARRPAVSELIMRFGPAKASFSLGGDKMALQWDQSVLFPNC